MNGFILDKSVENYDGAISALYALQVKEMRQANEEEKIGDKDEAYSIAQEYANTGFQIISDWLSNLKMTICPK